jgi:REP element-mobilizing transposase RayT
MSHSLVRIWIHGVINTSSVFINESYEQKLYNHLFHLLRNDLACPVLIINGTHDHIHLLFLLNSNQSIASVMKKIKGNSSHWINENKLTDFHFTWQTGYGAFGVSESVLEKLQNYIRNQKEHHKKLTFQEEFDKFLKAYEQTSTKYLNE